MYATTSKIGSQHLLASTIRKVLLVQGSEKAFNECLGLSSVFPSVVLILNWVLSLIAAKQKHAYNVLSKLQPNNFPD